MVWSTGKKLQGGKYVIQEILGQGGFGITYKALHVPFDQFVAIKTPNEYLRHDPDYDKYVDRFIREGRMLARLLRDPHLHIVRVSDLFEEAGTHCLVMDFIEGENLFQRVRRVGTLAEEEAVKYTQQIGEALTRVHRAKLVHRDAHPGNIILRENGNAVLIDFGIAEELVPSTQSSTGNAGNRGFAPYEQMLKGSRQPNVDVYCLAATLYFTVTGERPVTSLDRKTFDTTLAPPKRFNSRISDRLNRAILAGMELEPENRPQSMQAWLNLLESQTDFRLTGKQLQSGKYIIQKVLGSGGYGITYKALHVPLHQSVVIKTLNEYFRYKSDYGKHVERFIQEGRILARLSKDRHPHIVRVSDLFEEAGKHYLVMDFIDGENLSQRVKRLGALKEVEAIEYARQIGEALTLVHHAQLVHRDAHPGNIILRDNRTAVLIDFGIAKDLVSSDQSYTGHEGHSGFAPYEQRLTRNLESRRHPRVDVYCLAATFYFAVTGQHPQTSFDRKLGYEKLTPPQEINPKISDRLNRAILAGMELEPENRPQSMQAWLELLEAAPTPVSSSIASSIYPPKPKSPQPARQIPWSELVTVLILYGLQGFFLAAVSVRFWIVAVAVAIAIAVAVAVASASAWVVAVARAVASASASAWVVAFLTLALISADWVVADWVVAVAIAGAVAWVVAVAGAGAWAGKTLLQSFNRFHTFLILVATSGLGLGLGWLVALSSN